MHSLASLENSTDIKQQFFFNLTQNFKKSLIVYDIRPYQNFLEIHIKASVNIPLHPPFDGQFSLSDLSLISPYISNQQRLRRYCIIIGNELESSTTSRHLENLLKLNKCKEVHVYDGG